MSKNYIKRVLENVIKRAILIKFGIVVSNIFQDEFNIILSQQSTDVT